MTLGKYIQWKVLFNKMKLYVFVILAAVALTLAENPKFDSREASKDVFKDESADISKEDSNNKLSKESLLDWEALYGGYPLWLPNRLNSFNYYPRTLDPGFSPYPNLYYPRYRGYRGWYNPQIYNGGLSYYPFY